MTSVTELVTKLREDLANNRLQLPSLPQVVQKIRAAVNDERNGPYQMAKLIQMEPSMTARLIQIANSPAYRSRHQIDSCQLAIAHLGMGVTRDIVTCLAMHNVFTSNDKVLAQQYKDIWRHSCHVAAISYVLAKINPGFQADKALLAGLLHDIGVLPILHYAADYPDLQSNKKQLNTLVSALRGQVGKKILQSWNFDEKIVSVPSSAENWYRDHNGKPDYADIVIIAQIHSYFGTGSENGLPSLNEIPAFHKLNIGRLGPESSLEILSEAKEEISSVQRILQG